MLALKQKWQMKRRLWFDQLMSQTTGLSLQRLGSVEAGGKGPVGLYAGLSPLKPAVPQTRVLIGKDQGATEAC